LAYLKLRRGEEADAEFTAVLGHRGVEPMAPTWEMSQLVLLVHTLYKAPPPERRLPTGISYLFGETPTQIFLC